MLLAVNTDEIQTPHCALAYIYQYSCKELLFDKKKGKTLNTKNKYIYATHADNSDRE